MEDAVSALKIYFAAFIFMDLQYIGHCGSSFFLIKLIFNSALNLKKYITNEADISCEITVATAAPFIPRFKAELKISFIRKNELQQCLNFAKDIISLGTSGFVMQLTNSLVSELKILISI